ncbi:trimethylamine methyltransferase family protein [Chloroflexota bacterium]
MEYSDCCHADALDGGTGPASMISMAIQSNCEVLAMLCLTQVADPGTPSIRAPALATTNPRTGSYSAGAIEGGILSAAGIEMARYCGLQVEGSGGGTDAFVRGIQTSHSGDVRHVETNHSLTQETCPRRHRVLRNPRYYPFPHLL